jgi:GAF domain-containing protein
MDITNILAQVEKIIESKSPTALKEICCLLKTEVYHYDWVGIYVLQNNMLELEEYVGKATEHTEIAVGSGVCGQVAESNKSIIVQDVSKEDNYIACSLEVQSEIVVPIKRNSKFIAEIDIDSHSYAPFKNEDKELLENIAEKIEPLIV